MKNIIKPVFRRRNVTPTEYEMWKTNDKTYSSERTFILKIQSTICNVIKIAD